MSLSRWWSRPSVAIVAIAAVIAVALAPVARAASPLSLRMQANANTVRVGDVFQLDVILKVNGQDAVDELVLPDFDGFAIEQSRESQQASMELRGGRRAITVEHRRTFLLRPEHGGLLTIGAATAKMGDATATAPPIEIRVVGASAPTPGDPNGDDANNHPLSVGPDGALPEPGARFGDNPPRVFLELRPDKLSAYVGEQITVVGELWSQVALGAYPRVPGQKPAGFLCLPIDDGQAMKATQRRLRGRTWYVYPVTRDALFALDAGDKSLQTMEVTVSPAGSFFSSSRDITVRSAPVTVQIKPLPTPAPTDFHGAVGDFQLRTALTPSRTTVGEPSSLVVEVSGWGNLDEVRLPEVPHVDGLRPFPPTSRRERADRDGVIAGRVVEEALLQPTRDGVFAVPSLRFTFFHPAEGRYVTRTSPAQRLVVAAAGAAEAAGTGRSPTTAGRQQVLLPNLRPRPLALDATVAAPTRLPALPVGAAVLLAGLIVGQLGRRRRRHAESARGRAIARAQHRAATMAVAVDKADVAAATAVVLDALAERCGDDVRATAHAALPAMLGGRGLEARLAETITAALADAEACRYRPGGAHGDVVRRLASLLERLDGGGADTSRGGRNNTSGGEVRP